MAFPEHARNFPLKVKKECGIFTAVAALKRVSGIINSTEKERENGENLFAFFFCNIRAKGGGYIKFKTYLSLY